MLFMRTWYSEVRAERHKADAELLQRGNELLLGVAPPHQILVLHGGDRGHRVGAAHGGGSRLGQAPVDDLAFVHELAHHAGHVLDRHLVSTRCR